MIRSNILNTAIIVDIIAGEYDSAIATIRLKSSAIIAVIIAVNIAAIIASVGGDWSVLRNNTGCITWRGGNGRRGNLRIAIVFTGHATDGYTDDAEDADGSADDPSDATLRWWIGR